MKTIEIKLFIEKGASFHIDDYIFYITNFENNILSLDCFKQDKKKLINYDDKQYINHIMDIYEHSYIYFYFKSIVFEGEELSFLYGDNCKYIGLIGEDFDIHINGENRIFVFK